MKALVAEVVDNLSERLQGYGIIVRELSGDQTLTRQQIDETQIIVTTPEKWDIITRKAGDRTYTQLVKLLIVYEIHLLHDNRGPVLESIVARTVRQVESTKEHIRLVGLSATLPNFEDVALFLRVELEKGLFHFDNSYRPVPLSQQYIGITLNKPLQRFQLMNDVCYEKVYWSHLARPVPLEIHIQGVDIANFEARIQAMTKPTYTSIVQHSKMGKPAIVFVPTRKHVRLTAVDLMTYSIEESGGGKSAFLLRSRTELEPFISRVQEEMLRETLYQGIGYLHEGLSSLDQEVVFQLFDAGWIQVSVMTSSMCWGVPLSAHLVVVMGTQYYDGRENAHTDYSVTDLLQMMGHASRQLLVIENKQDAVDYLTWTFMYRRLTQNPNYYNLQGVSHRHLSDHLSELVENTLSDLEASNCVAIEDEMDISSLNLGMIASYYYISYTTIERFSSSLSPKTKMKGLLEILSSASEYAQLPISPTTRDFQSSEVLRRLINHQRVSFENPRYSDPHVKANALLQAHFSRQFVHLLETVLLCMSRWWNAIYMYIYVLIICFRWLFALRK